MSQPRLFTRPCPIRQAATYVELHHRHHEPPAGGLWACAVADKADGRICGVTIVGRPNAPKLQDGRTIEATRVCTDGTPNACSCLLGQVARYARLWHLRAITFTLPEEGGASLRAAGWVEDGISEPHGSTGWSNRPGRDYTHPEIKTRWVVDARRADEPDLVWPELLPDEPAQLTLLAAP